MKRNFMPLLVALTMLCCGCGSVRPKSIQSVDTAMGTVIQQNVYAVKGGDVAAEEIQTLLRELEEKELSRRLVTSEVRTVNESAGQEDGIILSQSLAEILEDCLDVWEKSEGAFDVTLGPVVTLWDIDGWSGGEREGVFAPPDDKALKEALEHCGSGSLYLEKEESGKEALARLYMPEGMELDLGAVGKGIALDRILGYLQENKDITGAIISVGGSILTYGEKPEGTSWRVGVVNPADTSDNVGILTLEGQWCVSTSGDYERYVEMDGVRYHHIIDPCTGYPADGSVAGVTILSKNGFLSDALSTACFILGPEKGMALAADFGAEALFVEKDGSLLMSEGMEKVFQPK